MDDTNAANFARHWRSRSLGVSVDGMKMLALVLVCVACSSSTPSTTSAGPIATCDPLQRQGTYLMTATQISGDCGAIASVLVHVSAQPAVGGAASGGTATCVVSDSTWSHGNCRNDLVQRCGTAQMTSYTVQTTADGAIIEGEMSVVDAGCSGTYGLRYVRQ